MKRTIETLQKQIAAQTTMINSMHSTIGSLVNTMQQTQAQRPLVQAQVQPQHRPPQPRPQPQAQRPQAGPSAQTPPPPALPQNPKGKGKEAQGGPSCANVARANNPAQVEFQLVEKKKKKPAKADPLFKPEFTKVNREIIVECDAPATAHPTEIRLSINATIPDTKCHFITARKTNSNNIVLETKFDTSAETIVAYKHEIQQALSRMRIDVIDVRANSKWSKFLLHGIPTMIGDGIEAGQLVASEIRNNYGEKFQLVQIPRWISKPENRNGKMHSSMIIALPGSFTLQTLCLRSLLLFDRRCTLETFFNIREDTQCRNCLEFGHRQEHCSQETARCGHCAGNHSTDNHPCNSCPGGVGCTHTHIRCFKCEGAHKAIDRSCPERSKATLRAQLRFSRDAPQKIPPPTIPAVPAAPPAPPATIQGPATQVPVTPQGTIQVPATLAPAPATPSDNDQDMGNL